MDFPKEQLDELRRLLSGKVSDKHLQRGVRLTKSGTTKVAAHFGIEEKDVQTMLNALSAETAKENVTEEAEIENRYTYEGDLLGNLTVRDSEQGDELFLRGDTAFKLRKLLALHPDRQQQLIAPFFNTGETLIEGNETSTPTDGGTFNFPYRGKFATAKYGMRDGKFFLKVISLRDDLDEETEITPEMQKQLDAVAMTWIDKV